MRSAGLRGVFRRRGPRSMSRLLLLLIHRHFVVFYIFGLTRFGRAQFSEQFRGLDIHPTSSPIGVFFVFIAYHRVQQSPSPSPVLADNEPTR